MSVSIIVGGQFGSEGKGKVAYHFAKDHKVIVRCGGTNSGHTIVDRKLYIFRQLPTASILPNKQLVLCAGSYIDLDILKEELLLLNSNSKLYIDPDAVIIQDKHISSESDIMGSIGSTGSGTGAAVIERLSRRNDILFAKDVPFLKKYIYDTSELFFNCKENILIEGTQGFGLSPLHSGMYPKVTSRDTTAAGFLSEVGISPLLVKNVIMVIRTYPIRVAGNSGPMNDEIDWASVSKEAGKDIKEYTSVTKHLRRVSKFDVNIVKDAIKVNSPNIICLNHLDYIKEDLRDAFVQKIELGLERKINYYGLNRENINELR